MANLHEIPPFPNPGVRLIKEDAHVAIWEEVFEPGKPTLPHRHMRDYVAAYPHGGELTIIPLAGEPEEFTTLVGEIQESTSAKDGVRLVFSAGAMIHGRVPAEGTAHYAVNEGQQPTLMILTEIRAVFSAVRPLVGSGSWHPIRQNSAPEWWQPSSKGT